MHANYHNVPAVSEHLEVVEQSAPKDVLDSIAQLIVPNQDAIDQNVIKPIDPILRERMMPGQDTAEQDVIGAQAALRENPFITLPGVDDALDAAATTFQRNRTHTDRFPTITGKLVDLITGANRTDLEVTVSHLRQARRLGEISQKNLQRYQD